MKEPASNLYQMMMADIDLVGKKGLTEVEVIECCFQVANTYWVRLREKLANYVFENNKEEIEFFKTIKPKFTSEIEYYNLLYHTQIFKPEYDPIEIMKFWTREADRLNRFIEDNKLFYEYYKARDCTNDEIYFLRANNDLSNLKESKVYDLDSRAATSHDHLIATILALQRYEKYVRIQSGKLKNE